MFFTDRNAFRRHQRGTHPQDKVKCSWSECGKFFSNISNMKAHSIKEHNQQILFKCEECEESFDTKTKLNVHVKIHVEKRMRISEAAQYTNEKITNLDNHMQNKVLKRVLSENKNSPIKINPITV